MRLHLIRYAYTDTETMGELWVKGECYKTIERPWIEGPKPGGMSFESCIPDGEYQLRPHTRPNGDRVVALINPDLGVWYRETDRPGDWGRYLILLHAGNYVSSVVGCVAPGLLRTIYKNRQMVTNSRAAMAAIMRHLPYAANHSILIEPTAGAFDG